MSSWNKYLNPAQREQATVLWRSIQLARKRVKTRAVRAESIRSEIVKLINEQPEARFDYVEFFDPETLQPAAMVRAGTQMAMAVFVGKTRLIDNAKL